MNKNSFPAKLTRIAAYSAIESYRLAGNIIRSAFIERLWMTSLFLLCASPWILTLRIRYRLNPPATEEKVSPFIYAMQ